MNDKRKNEKFLRLKQVLELIPVSKSTWWLKVKKREFPQPIKICSRITVWKSSDIIELMEEMANV